MPGEYGDGQYGGGTYADLTAAISDLPARVQRVLSMFPDFMRDSLLIKEYAIIISNEVDSRIGDLVDILVSQFFPQNADSSLMLSTWASLENVALNVSDPLSLARARILSKITRSDHIRVVDIANIVRFYLSGVKAYVTNVVINSHNIPVDSLAGFYVGQIVYIGSFQANIISIDIENKQLIIDTAVSVGFYTLVSTSVCSITDNFSAYSFNVNVHLADVLDSVALGLAIDRVKPAHLSYAIVDIDEPTYNDISLIGSYNDVTRTYNGQPV